MRQVRGGGFTDGWTQYVPVRVRFPRLLLCLLLASCTGASTPAAHPERCTLVRYLEAADRLPEGRAVPCE